MLLEKFKRKYGSSGDAARIVQQEVDKFVNNHRLTEENLKRLDDKIKREVDMKSKKREVLKDFKDGKSVASSKRSSVGDIDDLQSVRSFGSSKMSGATSISRDSAFPRQGGGLAVKGRRIEDSLKSEVDQMEL
jgi:hypothetical protein